MGKRWKMKFKIYWNGGMGSQDLEKNLEWMSEVITTARLFHSTSGTCSSMVLPRRSSIRPPSPDFAVSRYVKMTAMLTRIRKICKNCQK